VKIITLPLTKKQVRFLDQLDITYHCRDYSFTRQHAMEVSVLLFG
jgi:hypothetical protein